MTGKRSILIVKGDIDNFLAVTSDTDPSLSRALTVGKSLPQAGSLDTREGGGENVGQKLFSETSGQIFLI